MRSELSDIVRFFRLAILTSALALGGTAFAAGLFEPACSPGDLAGPSADGSTCGGPVAGPNGVYFFSGEMFHTAVDMRIRGRGMDFVWARTYRSRVSPNVGLGTGWTHSYDIRLAATTGGPSEADNARFPTDKETLVWDRPAMAAGDPAALRYCTLRSEDPADFAGATTVILDPDDADTTTIDPAVPPSGQLFAYLILPKNGTRAGSLGTDSAGTERTGIGCGLEGPELVLQDGTGRADTYRLLAPGTWTAPGYFRELTEDPAGGFDLTFPDTSTWNFRGFDGSPEEGRIESMVDRNGNTIAFRYDTLGRITEIVDTLARTIDIGYDSNGFLSSVTDFTGREVRYDYYPTGDPNGSFDDLRSATTPVVSGTPTGNDFPLGKTTVYTYSTGSPDRNLNHNLLSITDPKGQTFLQNVYGATTDPLDVEYDRVVGQRWGDTTDWMNYAYVPQAPGPGNGFAELLTIENDRVGNVTDYFYDALNRNVLRREYTGRAPDPTSPTTATTNRPVGSLRPTDPPLYETAWTYNADSQADRVFLPNGSDIERIYDSANPSRRAQGNTLSQCHNPGPLGGDQPRICETYDYDDGPRGTNFVTRYVDGRGNATRHVYDAAGNPMRKLHRIPSVVEDFDYNSFGQLISRTWPDNGSGHRRHDVYTYHTGGPQNGYRASTIVDDGGFALTTTYEYDARGNVVRTIDPKGNDSQLIYNALDQVVRRIRREVTPGLPRYETDLYYDANDNVVRVDVLNVDEGGIVSSNPHWTTIHEYDILDEPRRTCREAQPFTAPIPGPPDMPTCIGLRPGTFITEEYEYDGSRNPTRVRRGEAVNGNDPDNVVEMEYDERDLKFRDVRAPGSGDQSTTEYDYDMSGNLFRAQRGTDFGAPDVFVFRYDGYDRLVFTEDPMGNQERFEYDANDNVVRDLRLGELQDGPGNGGNVRMFEAVTTYDALDRVLVRTVEHFESDNQAPVLDGQSATELIWSDSSHVVQRIDDNGNATVFQYDTANRREFVFDARGNGLIFEYDANSNVVRRISEELSDGGAPPEQFVTDFTFDGLDRMTSQTDNVGNTREALYDSRDNRILEADARNGGTSVGPGNITRLFYDGVNREVATERQLTDDGTGAGVVVGQVVTQQQWDDSDRLTAQIDDNGNATQYEYDARGNRVQTAFGDGTIRTVAYDLDDNPVFVVDPNGSTTTIDRDLSGRIVFRSIVPGIGIQGTTFEGFEHDGLNRVVLAADDDTVVESRYDSLGRVIEEVQNGQSIRNVHDGVGNKLQTVYPSGRTIDRSYDALNRLDGILEGMGTLVEYDWIGPDRVESRRHANATQLQYTYDGILNPPNDFGVKRAVRTLHAGSAGPIDDRVYLWDRNYNKTLVHDLTPAGPQVGTAYAYDSLNRLVAGDRFDAAGPLGTTQYDLDGVTNRQAVLGGPDPGPYLLDPMLPFPADLQVNQYTKTSFDDRLYDQNGNLIVLDIGTADQRDVVYDYRNRMVQSFDLSNGTLVDYEYDAYGRRTRRVVNDPSGGSTDTRFFYDGWQVCEEQDAAGSPQATYVYGVDLDEVLTMNRGGNDFFFHGDEQFSVVALTDGGGNVVERYAYDDYGTPTIRDAVGTMLSESAVGNPYLFTGRRWDFETGWYYYRTRYMDPRAGRFTTRDTLGPWGDAAAMGNGYTYAAGNPATYRDPLGEAIYLHIKGVAGDVTSNGYDADSPSHDSFGFAVEREMKESGFSYGGWFFADTFSFAVEREMKESGEKGGTTDMNIGIGELQECTISKSMDRASTQLAQHAMNGNSTKTAEIEFVEVGGGGDAGKPVCYLKYKLDRCWVKSWSTSGDADDRPTEEVAFYYNKIAFGYAATRDGREFGHAVGEMKWDNVANGPWRSAARSGRCFIKSWSTSGDADDRPTEEVAFYYNKISATQSSRTDFSRGNPLVFRQRPLGGLGFCLSSGDAGEHAMKESGEKGGTADINIGIGE